MKHKTAELEGALLDAAVALAEGKLFEVLPDEWGERAAYLALMVNLPEFRLPVVGDKVKFCPSSQWQFGGPLIERERIGISFEEPTGLWHAELEHSAREDGQQRTFASGVTPLVAAMRAYVASKLGDQVELR